MIWYRTELIILYTDALVFAIEAHKNQVRKDKKPYISHPLSVAIELAKNGADDDLISAGLLHDTIEDTTVSFDELEDTFGGHIAALVSGDTEDKKLSWERRKKATIEALKNTNDRQVQMLICADKLSNIRDIKSALEKSGESAWSMFKYGKAQQAWLYKSLVDVLKPLEDLAMYRELKQTVEIIFGE